MIPFQLYDTFVIEEKFGFNKTTLKTFIIDQIKGLILLALIGGPILALILWIFDTVPMAWLWAWAAFTVIQLLLTYIAPSVFLPLFNKFEPMPEGELKDAINDMAKKCDFPLLNSSSWMALNALLNPMLSLLVLVRTRRSHYLTP